LANNGGAPGFRGFAAAILSKPFCLRGADLEMPEFPIKRNREDLIGYGVRPNERILILAKRGAEP